MWLKKKINTQMVSHNFDKNPFFNIFFIKRMEELLFLLLLKKDMNKLFKFYWRKETQMLILQRRFFLMIWISFSFSISIGFISKTQWKHSFSLFFYWKDGTTPLHIAARKGHAQIVQLLLEKGKSNVDHANKVPLILFICWFFLYFLNFLFSFYQKGWNNSSFYCCSKWRWTNCSNFIGERKPKCWSCWSGFFYC